MKVTEELILRILNGDREAFDEFCIKNQKEIENACNKFMRNFHTAEDMRQEVLLTIISSNHEYRSVAEFCKWVYNIIKTKCIDQLRKDIKRKTSSFESTNEDDNRVLIDSPIEAKEIPDEQIINKELKKAEVKAINELPKIMRDVYLLHTDDKMKIIDIAEELNISVPMTKKHFHNAQEILRKKLNHLR